MKPLQVLLLSSTLLSFASSDAPMDPLKSEACVKLANDILLQDEEVAKVVKTSKYEVQDTMQRISGDVLVYCYNHITSDVALQLITKQLNSKSPEVEEVVKYRKSLFETKGQDIKMTEEEKEQAKRILQSVKKHKRAGRKPPENKSEL